MRLTVFNNYTYTLETIIQAGQKQIPLTWIPVKTNSKLRESRLVRSLPNYVWRSLVTIIRMFVVYKPFRFFALVAAFFIVLGMVGDIRFLYYYLSGQGKGHIQSLILSSTLLGFGCITFLTALLADLLSVNRMLLEEIRYRLLKNEMSAPSAGDPGTKS
jgi:multisubunit Na+/H+ antiporter MnhG subunit